ncbi:hypothetical protein K2Y11_15350 [bacterium]|nr:hypothetical protein [bacterium]
MTGPEQRQDGNAELEFAAAVRLLRRGTPENGINLVPRWEEIIAAEQAMVASTPVNQAAGGSSSRSFLPGIRFFGWLQVAAIFVIGIGMGSVATGWMGAQGSSPAGPVFVMGDHERHYTEEQRNSMFTVLAATTPPPRDVVLKASRDLAACVTCHDSGMKDRLASWQQ